MNPKVPITAPHRLWRLNPIAPWPTDPSKDLEVNEKMWVAIDGLMKKGEIEEYGVFPDGCSGYTIGKGETVDVYRDVSMFHIVLWRWKC